MRTRSNFGECSLFWIDRTWQRQMYFKAPPCFNRCKRTASLYKAKNACRTRSKPAQSNKLCSSLCRAKINQNLPRIMNRTSLQNTQFWCQARFFYNASGRRLRPHPGDRPFTPALCRESHRLRVHGVRRRLIPASSAVAGRIDRCQPHQLSLLLPTHEKRQTGL